MHGLGYGCLSSESLVPADIFCTQRFPDLQMWGSPKRWNTAPCAPSLLHSAGNAHGIRYTRTIPHASLAPVAMGTLASTPHPTTPLTSDGHYGRLSSDAKSNRYLGINDDTSATQSLSAISSTRESKKGGSRAAYWGTLTCPFPT